MQLFISVFESVPDPRAENVRHSLVDILIIAFLSVLCGAQTCCEMAEFGIAKRRFLKRFLDLKGGIPSCRRRASPRRTTRSRTCSA